MIRQAEQAKEEKEMQFMSEELARLRRCELLQEAREQRLAAEVGRASRDSSSRRRRFGSNRG